MGNKLQKLVDNVQETAKENISATSAAEKLGIKPKRYYNAYSYLKSRNKLKKRKYTKRNVVKRKYTKRTTTEMLTLTPTPTKTNNVTVFYGAVEQVAEIVKLLNE